MTAGVTSPRAHAVQACAGTRAGAMMVGAGLVGAPVNGRTVNEPVAHGLEMSGMTRGEAAAHD